ncbi:sugar phosphate isomerase/epimerase [Paenibacillus antri]|uniref:Sugar phosphate isomerase/epimerase n=1 Tax=Paenibacillus antri TaxID=2582848 RepID=A0A5R9G3Q4_9BACL|nr:sugar phosphate isomerase/epimerase family protein [Paenibacillus antri]TLS51007.1 sugar phosphate isomerase/epimerase [Paenibacillus antri]
MKLGIGSYTFAWSIGVPAYGMPSAPVTAFDLIRIAAERGLSLVQIADNIPLHRWPEIERRRLKREADAAGVALEVGTRGTDPALLLDYLAIARELGSPFVRTLAATTDLALVREQLSAALPAYEAAGIAIALENHGLHTTKQLVRLFDDVGSPYLGCCLDTVNSFSALDAPDRVIADLTPYLINLHIKDFDITRIDHQMGFVVLGTPAGYGKLDIPRLLTTIREQGKRPNAILELWPPYQGSVEDTVALEWEWFRQSVVYLQGLPEFQTT